MGRIPMNLDIYSFKWDRTKDDLGTAVWEKDEDQTVSKWSDDKHRREKN